MRLSRRSGKGDIMFEIEIRDGLLHIGGYVNAVGRDSKPIFSKKRGRCVEQVTPGAFSSSLADGHEVFMKLNHEKVIATTADGSLELREDNIGLKAQATVSDEEVITMAEKGLLKAWSFGFEAIDDDMEERSGQLPRRHLNRIKLNEVSVLSKSPAYEGTLVELRDGDACEPKDTDGTADKPAKDEPAKDEPDETAAKLAEIRTFIALEEIGELIRQGEAEYRAYRDREEAQAFIDAAEAQQWIDEQEEEERYNPYHNPSNGQFTTAGGGGMGGILVVPKNGKRYYAQLNKGYSDEDIDDMYKAEMAKKQAQTTPEQTSTNAKLIDNMNEAQLDIEIEKTKSDIDRYQAIMDKNSGGTSYDQSMRESFPLGVGGSGWNDTRRRQFERNNEKSLKMAKEYTDAYDKKQDAQIRLKNLESAKEKVSGTGKTLNEIKAQRKAEMSKSLKWEKNGKTIKSGDYSIKTVASGFYSIYKGNKQIGFANKQSDAKAYVTAYMGKEKRSLDDGFG